MSPPAHREWGSEIYHGKRKISLSPREGPGRDCVLLDQPCTPWGGWFGGGVGCWAWGIQEEQLDRRRPGGAGEGRAGRSPARDPRLVPRGLAPQTVTDVGETGRASLSSSQRVWGAWPGVWAAGGGQGPVPSPGRRLPCTAPQGLSQPPWNVALGTAAPLPPGGCRLLATGFSSSRSADPETLRPAPPN